jgi:SSS family solute:Na+ symporter
MIFAVVAFLGIYLPVHFFGSFGQMFLAINAAKPGFLSLPAKGQSIAWFDSTVLLTALGFYMWPHTFTSIYTSRDERSFRRNAVFAPLYGLLLLFVMFVGFAASLKVPGLTGSNIDLSLFRLSIQAFDPWFVGVIGATGVLTALVPGSMILMAAAMMVANNFYRIARRSASDAEISVAAKVFVPVVALVAVYFTLNGGNTIVALLLMGYAFVTQLFPSLVASFLRQNFITKQGAFAGIAVGVAAVAGTTITGATFGSLFPGLPQMVQDLNIGIVALGLNVVTMLVVSAVTRRQKTWQEQPQASRP